MKIHCDLEIKKGKYYELLASAFSNHPAPLGGDRPGLWFYPHRIPAYIIGLGAWCDCSPYYSQ